MKSMTKICFLLSALAFLSCASASKEKLPPGAQVEQKEKSAVKEMTNQERIYHARFSGAFYDRF